MANLHNRYKSAEKEKFQRKTGYIELLIDMQLHFKFELILT
jgi:hypothetical protein